VTDRLNDVYEAFFDKIELDSEYFQYFDVDEIEAMKIAEERARSYLREACSYLRRHVTLDFNLSIEKDENSKEHFATPLTEEAIFASLFILASFVKDKVPVGVWAFIFHWSIFLFLCQYHAVLMTVVRKVYSSKSVFLFQGFH